MPDDNLHALKLLALTLDILHEEDHPPEFYGVAWNSLSYFVSSNLDRAAATKAFMDGSRHRGVADLAVSHLRASSSPMEWLVLSPYKSIHEARI